MKVGECEYNLRYKKKFSHILFHSEHAKALPLKNDLNYMHNATYGKTNAIGMYHVVEWITP